MIFKYKNLRVYDFNEIDSKSIPAHPYPLYMIYDYDNNDMNVVLNRELVELLTPCNIILTMDDSNIIAYENPYKDCVLVECGYLSDGLPMKILEQMMEFLRYDNCHINTYNTDTESSYLCISNKERRVSI